MLYRMNTAPREGWQKKVEDDGLAYAVDRETGAAYWHEGDYIEIDEKDCQALEDATEELDRMCLEATGRIITTPDLLARVALPLGSEDLVRESWAKRSAQPSVYGRMDLIYDGFRVDQPKLLEYNAECPAALMETMGTQWQWKADKFPSMDQANTLYERLVAHWRTIGPGLPGERVHFVSGRDEPDEDIVTVAAMMDCARAAGIECVGMFIEDLGWDEEEHIFVGPRGERAHTVFKMYPWDWMLRQTFGPNLVDYPDAATWIEPLWRAVTASKAILPVLWEMFPDHPNLLPAYFDDPHGMVEYAAKPVGGWEGAGISLVRIAGDVSAPERFTDGQPLVFQEYVPLPDFEGQNLVCGSWVISGAAAGFGFRESASPITNTDARFIPHVLNAPESNDEEIASYLHGPATPTQ
jgi:glutathionylspermidine synthase